MNPKSNIAVFSNVFPVSPEFLTPEHEDKRTPVWGVCSDPVFRKQVRGRPALRKLGQELLNWGNDERDAVRRMLEEGILDPWQFEVYFKAVLSGGCGCTDVGKTIGIVRRNGKMEVVCRCPNGRGCRVPQNVNLLSQ